MSIRYDDNVEKALYQKLSGFWQLTILLRPADMEKERYTKKPGGIKTSAACLLTAVDMRKAFQGFFRYCTRLDPTFCRY